jgi:hypothetical protein
MGRKYNSIVARCPELSKIHAQPIGEKRSCSLPERSRILVSGRACPPAAASSRSTTPARPIVETATKGLRLRRLRTMGFAVVQGEER